MNIKNITGSIIIYRCISRGNGWEAAAILDSVVALLLNLVSFFALRIVARDNLFPFLYGTGKLELLRIGLKH